MFQCRPQEVDFLLHQEARYGWQVVGHALGRGMRAMGRAKGIVDIEIAERGKLSGKCRIVLLLFLMEAQIFQQQHLSRL